MVRACLSSGKHALAGIPPRFGDIEAAKTTERLRQAREGGGGAAVAAAVAAGRGEGGGEGGGEGEADTPSSLGVEDAGFVDVEIGPEEEEVEGEGRREGGQGLGSRNGGMVMELPVMVSGSKVLAQ
jgi:hypothetical protein